MLLPLVSTIEDSIDDCVGVDVFKSCVVAVLRECIDALNSLLLTSNCVAVLMWIC
jgi:hypothetical protein